MANAVQYVEVGQNGRNVPMSFPLASSYVPRLQLEYPTFNCYIAPDQDTTNVLSNQTSALPRVLSLFLTPLSQVSMP
jgi:hypothetical protein